MTWATASMKQILMKLRSPPDSDFMSLVMLCLLPLSPSTLTFHVHFAQVIIQLDVSLEIPLKQESAGIQRLRPVNNTMVAKNCKSKRQNGISHSNKFCMQQLRMQMKAHIALTWLRHF